MAYTCKSCSSKVASKKVHGGLCENCKIADTQAVDKLARDITEGLLPYYAHEAGGDTEGMRITLENLLDTIGRIFKPAAKLKAMASKGLFDDMRCPTCKDYTWQDLSLVGLDQRVLVYGDCGHTWFLGKKGLN